MCSRFHDIRKSFASLRVDKKLRHPEMASFLEVTEAELIDSHVGVSKLDSIKSTPNLARAIRLKSSWSNLIDDVHGFGEVMSLTRNAHAVHENLAFYKHVSSNNDVGMVLSGELTMHLMYEHWEHGYLFEESKSTVLQRSIQFFDEFGEPVHKIFLLPHSHHWYFEEFAKKWADSNQDPGILVQEKPEHDPIIEKDQWALSAEERFAGEREVIDLDVLQFVLSSAVQLKLPLIITVQNSGAIQSHNGVIDEIRDHKAWFHLINEQFNCHLQLTHVFKIFINHQETHHVIKMFDHDDSLLAMIEVSEEATASQVEAWHDLLEEAKAREMSLLE